MNPENPPRNNSGPFVLSGIVAILALGFAAYEFMTAKQAQESLAVATRLHEGDQARLKQLNNRVKLAEQKQSELQQSLQQQRPAASEDARSGPGGPAPDSNAGVGDAARNARAKAMADGRAFMAAYGTKAHDMLMAIGKAQIARNFAALIESGSITPAQADELENQTAEHWIQTIAVTPNSIHPGDPNLPDDQMKEILGDQGYQQLQNYQRMQPLQGLVNDVSSLSVSAPLTPEQSTQLLNVLANASSNYTAGGKANPQSVDWNQVLPQAQGILSEAQENALKAEAQLPQIMSLVKQFYQNPPSAK